MATCVAAADLCTATPGDLVFEYFDADAAAATPSSSNTALAESNTASSSTSSSSSGSNGMSGDDRGVKRIYLPASELHARVAAANAATNEEEGFGSNGGEGFAKVWAELVAEHRVLPPLTQFELLARMRLCGSFGSGRKSSVGSRRKAVRRRLHALLALLGCHGTGKGVLEAFLQGQPELTHELVDLVSGRAPNVARAPQPLAAGGGGGGSSSELVRSNNGSSGNVGKSSVPLRLQALALEVLAALLARREGGAGLAAARHVNVDLALGIARGQYNGVLPTLLRKCIGRLTSQGTSSSSNSSGGGRVSDFQRRELRSPSGPLGMDEGRMFSGGLLSSGQSSPGSEADLAVGLAFVKAARRARETEQMEEEKEASTARSRAASDSPRRKKAAPSSSLARSERSGPRRRSAGLGTSGECGENIGDGDGTSYSSSNGLSDDSDTISGNGDGSSGDLSEDELEWSSALLTLLSVVVQQQAQGGSGGSFLSECGLVPALLSVLALPASAQATTTAVVATSTTSLSSSGSSSSGAASTSPTPPGATTAAAETTAAAAAAAAAASPASNLVSFRHPALTSVLVQVGQVLEALLACHPTAATAFNDLGGADVLCGRLHAEVQAICAPGVNPTPLPEQGLSATVDEDKDAAVASEDGRAAEEEPRPPKRNRRDARASPEIGRSGSTRTSPRGAAAAAAAASTTAANLATATAAEEDAGSTAAAATTEVADANAMATDATDGSEPAAAAVTAATAPSPSAAELAGISTQPLPFHRRPSGTEQEFVMALVSALACSFQTQGSSGGGAQLRGGLLSGALDAIIKQCHGQRFSDSSNSSSSTTVTALVSTTSPEATVAPWCPFQGKVLAMVAQVVEHVVNSDPQSLAYVHSCGLGASLLDALAPSPVEVPQHALDPAPPPPPPPRRGKGAASPPPEPPLVRMGVPRIPASAELVSVIPGILHVLSLTSDGAAKVMAHVPFPSLLALFTHPAYALPHLKGAAGVGEAALVVGRGVADLLHYQPSLRGAWARALVDSLKQVQAELEASATQREAAEAASALGATTSSSGSTTTPVEVKAAEKWGVAAAAEARALASQQVGNLAELAGATLPQHLEALEPFLAADGLTTLLSLFKHSLPTGRALLAHASAATAKGNLGDGSSSSGGGLAVAPLANYHTGRSMGQAMKQLGNSVHCQCAHKLLRVALTSLEEEVDALGVATNALREAAMAEPRLAALNAYDFNDGCAVVSDRVTEAAAAAAGSVEGLSSQPTTSSETEGTAASNGREKDQKRTKKADNVPASKSVRGQKGTSKSTTAAAATTSTSAPAAAAAAVGSGDVIDLSSILDCAPAVPLHLLPTSSFSTSGTAPGSEASSSQPGRPKKSPKKKQKETAAAAPPDSNQPATEGESGGVADAVGAASRKGEPLPPLLLAYAAFLRQVALVGTALTNVVLATKACLARAAARPPGGASAAAAAAVVPGGPGDWSWCKELSDARGLLRCAGLHLGAMKEANRADALENVRHSAAANAAAAAGGSLSLEGGGRGGKSGKASSKGRGTPQPSGGYEGNGRAPWPEPSGFLLHVVCAHGAVVRDGPEIDTCATVDTREMGTVLWATERRAVSQVKRRGSWCGRG